jgi:1A family penicillin-binding protein
MTNNNRRKPPLVADKRAPASSKRKSSTKPKVTTNPRRKKKAVKRNPVSRFFRAIFRWIWKIIWGVGWRVTALGVLVLGLAIGYFYTTLPPLIEVLDGRAKGSVTMLDTEGKVFAWRGDQFGGVVTADTVSPHLKNAIIATEDKRFYGHWGVSPRGIASAIRINLREGRGPLSGNGGSTLTQQTAKLLCMGEPFDPTSGQTEQQYERECRRGTIQRKVQEMIYAMAMELKYSKDDILSIYLNRAYMGGGAYGAEAASQRFFGKSANEVTPPEGAMLAGLLTAPTTLSPTANLDRSRNRAATVLRLMREQGYLTPEEEAVSRANPAVLSEAAEKRAGGYFADWVMSTGPEFFTRDTTEDVIIRTTLDQRIQKAAEDGLAWVFENKVRKGSEAQAAVIVMSADGAVRAMVGGRQKVSGGFNRATQALRQTGSAFKPFVYATALELGYSPNDYVLDEPTCWNIPGSGEWCPKNYTNKYYGDVTLTQSLKDSLNIPAVKVAESVGLDLVRTVAADFGLEGDLALGPALALGASESTLINMTGAYAGILNGGSSVTPYGLTELKLLGDDEPLIGTGTGIGERVIQEDAARQLIFMMEKVVSNGSGGRAAFGGRQIAGKTGTTQAARDAWFVGFSADYVAAVWMGYDDNTPLTGVTGGGLPAEIFREVMSRAHEGLPNRPLPMLEPEPAAPTLREFNQPVNGQGGGGIEKLLRDLLGGGGNGTVRRDPTAGDR